jgi:hypothetical protein
MFVFSHDQFKVLMDFSDETKLSNLLDLGIDQINLPYQSKKKRRNFIYGIFKELAMVQ